MQWSNLTSQHMPPDTWHHLKINSEPNKTYKPFFIYTLQNTQQINIGQYDPVKQLWESNLGIEIEEMGWNRQGKKRKGKKVNHSQLIYERIHLSYYIYGIWPHWNAPVLINHSYLGIGKVVIQLVQFSTWGGQENTHSLFGKRCSCK